MTISINPVDFRGFGLGAPSIPQLPGIGSLGLQAFQVGASQANAQQEAALAQARIRQADEAMLRQNILERQKLAMQDAQFNKNLALDKSKIGIQERQNIAENAYKQQVLGQSQDQFGLDVRKQGFNEQMVQKQTAMEQMKASVEALSKKKTEDLNNIGSFAAQAQITLSKETDSTRANLLRNELTDQAVALGIVPSGQAKQLKQMTLTQFKQATGMLAFQADKAKEMQAMMVDKNAKSDVSISVGPNGELTYNSMATKANVTKSQEAYTDAKAGLDQLSPYLNPPENFFGLAAVKQDVNYLRELGKSIGIGPDEKDVSEMALYKKYNANAKLQIMQTAKSLAGARFSDADLAMIQQIMPQVGKTSTRAEYMEKADLIKKLLNRTIQVREQILSTGKYKLGTEEYDKAFSDKLPGIISEIKSETEPKTYKYNPATKKLELQ